MSFGRLLRHSVVVRRRFAVLDGSNEPTYDELGQPITQLLPTTTWRCRIEPLTAEEVALLGQAGAVVSTHRIYGFPIDLETGDQLVDAPRVYEVNTIDDAGGAGHHFEVQATLTTSEEPEVS